MLPEEGIFNFIHNEYQDRLISHQQLKERFYKQQSNYQQEQMFLMHESASRLISNRSLLRTRWEIAEGDEVGNEEDSFEFEMLVDQNGPPRASNPRKSTRFVGDET